MKIVLVRVDDRLIHGQVTYGWTRTVGAHRIVVADDAVANDETQKKLLTMVAPAGVKVSILSVADAGQKLAEAAFQGENVVVLVREPQALLGLMDQGVNLQKVNIGNVRSTPGRKRLSKEVHATPEELEAWKKLHEAGIQLEAQWLPGHGKTDFNAILRKMG